jgi:hypothetical protein
VDAMPLGILLVEHLERRSTVEYLSQRHSHLPATRRHRPSSTNHRRYPRAPGTGHCIGDARFVMRL